MNAAELTNIVEIRTPEGISFPLHLASPVSRCLAWTMDFFCILVLQNALSMIVRLFLILSPDFAQGMAIALYFVISILYGIILEWAWNGQTFGKRMFCLRVIDADGMKLSPSQVVVRNLLRAVDCLPAFYLAGGAFSLLSPRYQRLGDIAGRTYVIRELKAADPDLNSILTDKYNSFRNYPYLMARARAGIPPNEATLLLRSLLRRDTLDAQRRAEIYSKLAEYVKEKALFPQEATDGLSDERYLKNIVDILYRR